VKFLATKKDMTTHFFTPLFCCCLWIRDQGSGIRHPGWVKIRIRDKHHGSRKSSSTPSSPSHTEPLKFATHPPYTFKFLCDLNHKNMLLFLYYTVFFSFFFISFSPLWQLSLRSVLRYLLPLSSAIFLPVFWVSGCIERTLTKFTEKFPSLFSAELNICVRYSTVK